MARIVSVHSFRGGTGKSNLTANLAALTALGGRRVGVVDTDIQSPGSTCCSVRRGAGHPRAQRLPVGPLSDRGDGVRRERRPPRAGGEGPTSRTNCGRRLTQ